MADFTIDFHCEDGGRLPQYQELLHDWIVETILAHGGQPGDINYIFCGDDYLHRLNVQYLSHDTLTDIITFPFGDFPLVSGDLFISTERVADNARDRALPYVTELHRVVIHGVLHLCGQGDKTDEEAATMRRLEDQALLRRPDGLTQPDER